jgi:hypothetical protein
MLTPHTLFAHESIAYMLAECPNDIAALFSSTRILQEAIHNSLLALGAALTLRRGDLNQGLIDALNRKWLRLSQGEALFLLRFKGDVPGISILVVNVPQSPVV